jgi:acetyl-CoA carboxylase biotin carboxylase subunit
MPFFEKVLVANRGEIACRILRTCRDLGLATVAVYSDADADEPHVKLADEAVRIGPAPVRESYLDIEAVMRAARLTGAQAVHPGYGFLSENADFAEAVRDEGLVFIGPRAETIRSMGSKAGARTLMASHGVPIVPGYSGLDQSDDAMVEAAAGIGFPVLIKASAGGGGKGMSIVRSVDEMAPALAQARRVAHAAFGDATLLLERYVESPRHVEVQIFGDTHGDAVHLFERECSVQRRFQKIVEESPSPAPTLTPALREALCEAGVTAARAMGYEGAGTVEFLLDPQGRFYFLEVNTRLQVEHPVTEMVTGLDLVRLQILVAQGMSLRALLPEVRQTGHAIEVRLYAEDPENDFLPATGHLLEWAPPAGPGLRFDTGIAVGSRVDIWYDPLLAKVIAWGPTRAEAILRLAGALRGLGVQGVRTNRAFLQAVLAHPAFQAGDTHTHFIADHFPPASRHFPVAAESVHAAAIAAALVDATTRRRTNPHVPAVRPGFRLHAEATQTALFDAPGGEVRVEYAATPGGRWRARVGADAWQSARLEAAPEAGPAAWRLTLDARTRVFHVLAEGDTRGVRGPDFTLRLVERPRFPEAELAAVHGGCVAPMPGRVVQVLVEAGAEVGPGTPLVILEAMKMEQTLTASGPATVDRVCFAAGDRVEAGAVLLELTPIA